MRIVPDEPTDEMLPGESYVERRWREADINTYKRMLSAAPDVTEELVVACAKALWRLECQRNDEFERREGRVPPRS